MISKKQIEDLLKNGKHFCLAPWVHLHVTGLGNMSFCSMSEMGPYDPGYGDLNKNSFTDLWQGKEIRDFRLKMLNDKPDPRCLNCYNSRLGHWTLRKEINRHYNNHLDWVMNTDKEGFAPETKPIFWDIRFSNVCNLKCRSCIDVSSSKWYQDAKALGFFDKCSTNKAIRGVKNKSKLLHELETSLPYLKGIRFAGGEPLLIDENYTIIKKLDELGKHDIRIEYETNMTNLYFKNYNLLSLWKKFKNILVSISLDGIGKKCEYLRKGLKWKKVLSNLNDIKKHCPNVDIRINYTISAYNILHLSEFHKEMVETKYISADQIQLIFAVEPNFLSMKILPKEIKSQATKNLKKHIRWLRQQQPFNDKTGLKNNADNFMQWMSCIKNLNDEDWTDHIPRFIDYTNKLDVLRKENCLSIFPELKHMFH